ncbi:unnamed protein product [Mortierella alpina]
MPSACVEHRPSFLCRRFNVMSAAPVNLGRHIESSLHFWFTAKLMARAGALYPHGCLCLHPDPSLNNRLFLYDASDLSEFNSTQFWDECLRHHEREIRYCHLGPPPLPVGGPSVGPSVGPSTSAQPATSLERPQSSTSSRSCRRNPSIRRGPGRPRKKPEGKS